MDSAEEIPDPRVALLAAMSADEKYELVVAANAAANALAAFWDACSAVEHHGFNIEDCTQAVCDMICMSGEPTNEKNAYDVLGYLDVQEDANG